MAINFPRSAVSQAASGAQMVHVGADGRVTAMGGGQVGGNGLPQASLARRGAAPASYGQQRKAATKGPSRKSNAEVYSPVYKVFGDLILTDKMNILTALEPVQCNQAALAYPFLTEPEKHERFDAALFFATQLTPDTPIFNRSKSDNIQTCAMEHARLGYKLRNCSVDSAFDHVKGELGVRPIAVELSVMMTHDGKAYAQHGDEAAWLPIAAHGASWSTAITSDNKQCLTDGVSVVLVGDLFESARVTPQHGEQICACGHPRQFCAACGRGWGQRMDAPTPGPLALLDRNTPTPLPMPLQDAPGNMHRVHPEPRSLTFSPKPSGMPFFSPHVHGVESAPPPFTAQMTHSIFAPPSAARGPPAITSQLLHGTHMTSMNAGAAPPPRMDLVPRPPLRHAKLGCLQSICKPPRLAAMGVGLGVVMVLGSAMGVGLGRVYKLSAGIRVGHGIAGGWLGRGWAGYT